MRIPGLKILNSFSRWVQARILGGALILGYHRIANVQADPYEVCVSPENFAEHLELLRKYTHPVSLSELVEHLKAGSLSPNSVAVTFDDGYVDNLYEARPLLEKYEIPAIIFVCTGYAGREFWWDELERLVITSDADLQALHLQVGENLFIWKHPTWKSEVAGLEVRRHFHHALYHFLLSLHVEEQIQALKKIRVWSDLPLNKTPISRAMNYHELMQLADGGLIQLGAHTRHHPVLPMLSPERQKDEILSGKQDLEDIVGKPVEGFAYPNGRAYGITKQIVCEAGFAYACTSLHDVVRPASDLYELTRFWQKDVDGDKFLQGLSWWMNMQKK